MFFSMMISPFCIVLICFFICSGKKLTISFRYQLQPTVGLQRNYVFPEVQEVMMPEK